MQADQICPLSPCDSKDYGESKRNISIIEDTYPKNLVIFFKRKNQL